MRSGLPRARSHISLCPNPPLYLFPLIHSCCQNPPALLFSPPPLSHLSLIPSPPPFAPFLSPPTCQGTSAVPLLSYARTHVLLSLLPHPCFLPPSLPRPRSVARALPSFALSDASHIAVEPLYRPLLEPAPLAKLSAPRIPLMAPTPTKARAIPSHPGRKATTEREHGGPLPRGCTRYRKWS